MSTLLADLIGASEPGFSLQLRKLERACGHPSADVRLTADILQKSHKAMRDLGLDPHDTTSKELYHALLLRVEQDEKRLRKFLNIGENASLDELLPKVLKCLDELNVPSSVWALKHTVAKRILQATPPKQLMKQLGYRSVDSMLKRETTAAVIAAAMVTEGISWQQKFYAKCKQLNATDCEKREAQLVLLNNKRWQFIAKQPGLRRRLLLPVPELGALVILPMSATVLPGAGLAIFLSLVYHINKLRSLSAQVKLQQVKQQFGRRAVNIWRSRGAPLAFVANQPLSFDVVRRYVADTSSSMYPELFDPHLQAEDLQHSSPEMLLSSLDPRLGFWHENNPSGINGAEGPVSLLALDAAINYCNHLAFDQRSLRYVQEALEEELLLRYLHTPKVLEQVIQQLESENTTSLPMIEAFA